MKNKNIFLKFLKKIISENLYMQLSTFVKFHYCKKEIAITQKYALLRNKEIKKEKITVIFIIWMETMWNSLRSVYEYMEKNPKFDTYIIAQPQISNLLNKQNLNTAYDFLKQIYPNVINAYENGNWFDLEKLHPDYVFYTYPYISYYYQGYLPTEVRKFAKVCLIQYGFNIVKNAIFDTCYNYSFSKNVSIHFASCKTVEKRLKYYYGKINKYPKIINVGFPRFDLIKKQKCTNSRKCIMWTPRWSLQKDVKYDSGSSFLKYYKNFQEFAKAHKDCDFILRPHPLMFSNFINGNIMTKTEIETFKQECLQIGNITIDETADYLESINKSDIFLTDLTSLIVEYFVTGKPVIFLTKAKRFMQESKIMDKTLYHAFSWDEIETILIALLNNKDNMENLRTNAINSFLPNNEKSIAERITDVIIDDYYYEENNDK